MRRLLLFLVLCTAPLAATPPKLTIICVVDQLAEHLFTRHKPFFRGGLRHLATKGYDYSNAYHPHGLPATATGHAALSTGAYASQHGLVANSWIKNGREIKACDSDHGNHQVFCPGGTHKKQKSADALLAQTLASSFATAGGKTISLSLKSRAAIPLSGPDGLPVWFDSKTGQFTSSKAFTPQLPPFVSAINTHLRTTLHNQTHTKWQAKFPLESAAYQFTHDGPYRYTAQPFCMVGEPQPFDQIGRAHV